MENQKEDLQTRVNEFLHLQEQIRLINSDIKDIEGESELTKQISDLSNQLKELREKRNLENADLKEMKEKRTDLKERQELIKEIILQDLKTEQPSLGDTGVVGMEYKGYQFKVKEVLKILHEKLSQK